MTVIAALSAAFVVAALLTRRFCNPVSRLHILDYPNERSLHERPVPRSGGVALLGGLVAGGLVAYTVGPSNETGPVLAGSIMIAAISFLDDRYDVSPLLRILVHLSAAAWLVAAGFAPPLVGLPGGVWNLPPAAGAVLGVIFVVWMINLYNFMDGMDGFAGGMAVIGFSTLAACGLVAGQLPFALANLLVAAAAAGFLLFNLPPARIFLGDTGASTLGFLAAASALWGSRENLFPLWLAVLVFSPFIVDASVTLLQRLLRGEKIWQAHRSHFYQRLVRVGWGHRRTLLAEYALMLACSLSALLALRLPETGRIVLVAVWSVIYLVLMAGVGRLEKLAAS